MVELAEQSANIQVTRPTPLPKMRLIDRRLSAEMIAELVQAYRDGTATPKLRQRYGLSQGSVIKILHDHGVQCVGKDLPTMMQRRRPSYIAAAQR